MSKIQSSLDSDPFPKFTHSIPEPKRPIIGAAADSCLGFAGFQKGGLKRAIPAEFRRSMDIFGPVKWPSIPSGFSFRKGIFGTRSFAVGWS